MKSHILIITAITLVLSGCAIENFARKQWNHSTKNGEGVSNNHVGGRVLKPLAPLNS